MRSLDVTRREPQEPAERRQRGSARQRAQPAARRLRVDRHLGAANTNWHNAHNFYGDLAELEAATLEDVRQFFKTYYAPNNAVLVVAGDATAADVRRLAEKHFGSIPRQPQPPPADLGEPPQTAAKHSTRERRARAHAGDGGRLAPAAAHVEGLLRAERARSAAQQRRQRADVSQAGARRSAGDVELGRLQLPRHRTGT